jgi:large subunit ribosomal protein L25
MATLSRTTLTVEPRLERGSRAGRRLRRAGQVPGIIYGVGAEPTTFKVDARKLRAVLAEGHALFDVELDGQGKQPVILKESQRDPVRGDVLHVDLLRVRLDEKIQSTVPLELEGGDQAPGVKEGGVLGHVTREIVVEALPTDIPDRILVDVSMLDIGQNLTLDAVASPSGVEFVADNPEETVVATVTAPTKIEEPEIEEEAELVGEELEKAAEAAEAEAAEGEEPGKAAEEPEGTEAEGRKGGKAAGAEREGGGEG